MRKLRGAVILVLLAALQSSTFSAKADPTPTAATFDDAEWILLLPDVRTGLKPFLETPIPYPNYGTVTLYQERVWDIAIIKQEDGVRILVAESPSEPVHTDLMDGTFDFDLSYAENAEDVLLPSSAVSVQQNGLDRTISIDGNLPKTGAWDIDVLVQRFGTCNGGFSIYGLTMGDGSGKCSWAHSNDGISFNLTDLGGGGSLKWGAVRGSLAGEVVSPDSFGEYPYNILFFTDATGNVALSHI